MDFHSMKRKQLQALCKQHKIPANLSNRDMADKLTEFLKEKETPVVHEVMEEQEEIVNEVECNSSDVNRKVKKVRFSPEHELIEFTRVQKVKRRSRRDSVCRADSNWPVEVVECSEVNKETVGRRGRTTRAGELRIMEEEINQKKRGVKAVKCNDGQTITSAVEILDDEKLEEGDMGKPGRGRVTRSRVKMEARAVKNTGKKEKMGAKDDERDEKASDDVNNEKQEEIPSAVEILEDNQLEDDDAVKPGKGRITRSKKGTKDNNNNKRDEKASDGFNNEKHEENAGNHSRVTRSRSQKFTEAPEGVGKRGRRVVKNIGKVTAVGAEAVYNGESDKGTTVTVSAEGMQDNGEGLKECLAKKQTAGEHVTVESQVPFRRSKRKENMDGDSEIFNKDMKKHENGGTKYVTRVSKFGSQVDAKVTGSEANPGKREVQKTEEPTKKVEPRRSNRRKTMVDSVNLKDVPEVSKDEKMILQPNGVVRRSRRKTLSLKLDSANDTDPVVEDLEVEKHASEPCLVEKEDSAVQNQTSSRSSSKCKSSEKIGGDSNVHHNDKVNKRKRGHVSRGDVTKKNNDHNSGVKSLKESGSKKIGSSVDAEKLANEEKQPHRPENPHMLDVSKDSESNRDICSENIIGDMELTSMKEDVSIADRAGDSGMKLTDEENSGTNTAYKVAPMEKNSTVSEDKNRTSNIKEVEKGGSQFEFDAQHSTEESITEVDKNPESQVYIQMEDSGCNNKIDDQVVADGLNVSVKEGYDRTLSPSDSRLLGDHTDLNTDLEVAEIEGDECLQSCTKVVDHLNDTDHLEASNNILDDNSEDASQIAGEFGIFASHGTSKLKEPSSSMTRHHGDNVTEGNETIFHTGIEEVDEAVEDSCSKECGNASNHIGEFDMLDLCSGETCGDESSKGHLNNCEEDGDCSLANLFEAEGIYGITPQDSKKCHGETHEGESSEGHMSKSDEDGRFSLANLFDSEVRVGNTPQDREKSSGEHLVMDFDEQGMSHDFTFVAPTITCNSPGDHEANLSVGGKPCNYTDKHLELTEAEDSGHLESHKKSKNDDYEVSNSSLFDGEKSIRIEPQDLPAVSAIKDHNERGIFPDLSDASPMSNGVYPGGDGSNSEETNPSTPSSISKTPDQRKSHSAKSSALVNSKQQQAAWSNASQLAGNSVCLSKSYAEGMNILVTEGSGADEDGKEDSVGASDVKNCHMSKSDEDGGFSLANLFDSEVRVGNTPQDREKSSSEHLVMDFDEQGMSHDFTFVAPTITCNSPGDHEAILSVVGKPCNYTDKHLELTEAEDSGRLESHKKSKNDDYEVGDSSLFDGEESIGIEPQDLPAESAIKDHNERGTFPDLSDASPMSNGVYPGGDGSNSEETNPSTPSSISKTPDQRKSHSAKSSALVNSKQQQAAWSNASQLAGNSVCLSKSYAEGMNILVAEGSGADEDGKEDSVGASDVKNCLISKIAAESHSDIKFHDSVETESRLTELHVGEEVHATQWKSWTETAFHNDTSSGIDDSFHQGSEMENMTISKKKGTTNKSGSLTKQNGKEMEGDSRNECAETKYKDVVSPTGFSADIYENELKRLFATPVKMLTPFKIEETYSHERILDSSVTSIKKCCDTMKGNAAAESMPDEEVQNAGYEVENNFSIGTPLSDNGGDDICEEIKAHNTSDGGNIQNTEAVVESCDADLQKLDLPAYSHFPTASSDDGNILREPSVQTSSDPEEENFGSCQKDVADKGISPSLFSEASPDCKDSTREIDDQYGTKISNEEDDNPELSQDISDELHTNNEVEVQNNISIGQCPHQDLGQFPTSDELESTCMEAKGMGTTTQIPYNADAVAEHESYVFGAVSGIFSNSEMPSCLGHQENGDTSLEAGELSNNGGDDTCENIDKADTVKLKDTTAEVLSKTEYDGCEASLEQLTENTRECEKETNFMTEDNEENVYYLGQSSLPDKVLNYDSESAEGNTISLSGSPNNLDKLRQFQDMLIDTALSESLTNSSSDNHKSERKMAQSCEAALELSDADLQKSNVSKISHLTGCFEDISEEASFNSGPLVAELANVSSPNSQNRDKGTSLHHSSNVSPVHDELMQCDSADDLNGDKVCDEIDANVKSSEDKCDEPHVNSEVEILKTLPDSDNVCEEAEKLPGSIEIDNALLEANETGTTTQDMKTTVPPTAHDSSPCNAVSSILSSSEMHLHRREDIDGIDNLDEAIPVFSFSGDSGKKNDEKSEGKSTAHMVEFSFQELHFKENVADDFKNDDFQTISNSPVSGCDEMLKESDVADTIKEYIDSESSLSVIFENSTDSPSSHVLAQTDERIACENSALSEHGDAIVESLANSKDEDNTPSVDCLETEIKEQEEATSSIKPAQDSGNAANSARFVGQFTEGSVKLDAQKKVECETARSTMRKNTRTILIHGTPNKLHAMADMKENAQTQKNSNIGDITAVRPAKRRALRDVNWK